MSKQDGGNCGCSSGGENALGGLNTSGGLLMSGGSGYGFNARSSPMLLGPNSGYGAIDPYEVGITSGATRALAYPPLTKFLGGQRRKSSSKSKSKSKSNSKSRRTRGGKSKSSKSKSKSSKSKSKRRSRGNHQKKQKLQKGGELSFSDFVSSPSAASSPSVGQVASSPTYGADLSPLGHKLSALANPIRPEVKNTCK